MSTLPANATAVDIEEEIVLQQTLISSLDPLEVDYNERLAALQTELGLLEERLEQINNPNLDISDSSISFDSASTSLTVPSLAGSESGASSRPRSPDGDNHHRSKRPLPSDFTSSHSKPKRPTFTPFSNASYTERARLRQLQAEATWKYRQQQREKDEEYARELARRSDAGDVSRPGPSSGPAFQTTLNGGASVLPPVRSQPPQREIVVPTRIKPDPEPLRDTNRAYRPPQSSNIIDLTADDPSSQTTLFPRPTYESPASGMYTPTDSSYGLHTTPHMPPAYAPPAVMPQSYGAGALPTFSSSHQSMSRPLPPTTTHLHSLYNQYQQYGYQNAASTSNMMYNLAPIQGLQRLVNTSGLGSSWLNTQSNPIDLVGDDDLDDNEDDDDLVYQMIMNGMPGAYGSSSFNTYAGREDLFRSRYEQLEAYNPEKTREELSALLNNIRPDEELPDHLLIQTPEAMAIKLHKYQELGLTWLKKCEEGSNKGGVLADDMGLGKTIQMLSLIVSHKSSDPRCKTTLIVAPVALLRQWKQEIEQRVKRRCGLSVYVHHSTGKKTHFRDLAIYDIVLTTFGSLAIEARKMEKFQLRKKNDSSAVPRADELCTLIHDDSKWYRVILDEAQCIKNRNTQTARAAFMLKAEYRFCMTGTPMMNNVTELYSLIKFLRIKPYDRWEKFRQDIAQPVKSAVEGSRDNAMQRLQALCKAVMLRRTKKSEYRGKPILVLPERTTEVDHAEFDEDEDALYNSLEQKTQITFNKYIAAGTVGRSYSAILVLLLRLRQACCHPYLIKDLSVAAAAGMSADALVELAQELSEQAVARIKATDGNFECPICMDAVINPAIFLPCGHDTCRECYVKLADSSRGIAEGHENGAKARCPHCRGDIDPKRITDFTSFKRVWMPELLTREEKEQFGLLESEIDTNVDKGKNKEEDADADDIETESESDNDDSTESEGEGSDLDGFIVNDDESESEMQSKRAGKRKVDEKKSARKSKKSKKSKGKKPKKELFDVDDHKRLTFANLKANARGSSRKQAKLFDKLRESYKDSAKIRQMIALLEQITSQDSSEKILVFSQWTSLLDLCEIAMEPKGWDYRRYDGSMNAKDRADAVDDFKDARKDVRIMLVSLKAGNAGLNLNVASQVIILDPFWNPYIEEQAIDRAHRIGQTRPVKVHRILIQNTVEDRIIALQENKRKIIETALDEQQASQLSRLGPRELAYLFGVTRNINDPV